MTHPKTEKTTAPGPAGAIELLVDTPATPPQGLALVAHPHPLFGGANTNKVTHTVARAHAEAGLVTLRPNFRGVGGSAGQHDHGVGETEDLLTLLAWAFRTWDLAPVLYLGGFSFGAYVATRVARILLGETASAVEAHPNLDPEKWRAALPPLTLRHVTLVGLPHGLALGSGTVYTTPELPTTLPVLMIHGEEDTVAPLSRALDWARASARPIAVVPGADHFFHGKLHVVKTLVKNALAVYPPA
jgi:alpha/beta superfamily hydrolase